MSVRIIIPTPLQRLTYGKEVVEGKAGRALELAADLDKRYPGIAEKLCEGGKIRRFINIYLNEEDTRFLSPRRRR